MLTLKKPIATLHRDEKNIQVPKISKTKTKKKATKTKSKVTKKKVVKKVTGQTMSIFK